MRARFSVPPARRVLAAAWAFLLGGGIVAGTVAVACSNGPEPRFFAAGASMACEGPKIKPITASECPAPPGSGLGPCPGDTAYALCNNNTFSVCTCSQPSDYDFDVGVVDGGAGAQVPGLVVFDQDGGLDLPICCTGNLVFELPASDCPARCTGTSSFAVCVDNAWTHCSCEIPDGFGFSDLMCDAGDY
jgi:hypothetical protein